MANDQDRAAVFRRNLRGLLRSEWLSQREAADEIGVRYKWIRRLCHHGLIRTDRRTQAKLEQVAEFFGLERDDLWNPECLKQPKPSSVLVKWTGSKRRQADSILSHFPSEIVDLLRAVRRRWSDPLSAAPQRHQGETLPMQRHLPPVDRDLESRDERPRRLAQPLRADVAGTPGRRQGLLLRGSQAVQRDRRSLPVLLSSADLSPWLGSVQQAGAVHDGLSSSERAECRRSR